MPNEECNKGEIKHVRSRRLLLHPQTYGDGLVVVGSAGQVERIAGWSPLLHLFHLELAAEEEEDGEIESGRKLRPLPTLDKRLSKHLRDLQVRNKMKMDSNQLGQCGDLVVDEEQHAKEASDDLVAFTSI